MFGHLGLHEYFAPADTDVSRALLARVAGSGRAEAQAAAARLDAIWELFELRRKERGEMVDWAVDTWAAVGAEVAARDGALAVADSGAAGGGDRCDRGWC
jgi:hypothetical protein